MAGLTTPGSRPVESRQEGPHPRLSETVAKHRDHRWQKPLAEHNVLEFERLRPMLASWSGPLVLDVGCGTGLSTVVLAQRFPTALVVGLDKSLVRLSKHPGPTDRCLWVRTDAEDFWRLANHAGLRFHHQALWYPNPWPKPEHRLRRWSFHPVLPEAVATGGTWEVRTNWQVYAQEMAEAFALLTGVSRPVEPWEPAVPETLFEKKYLASGHRLWCWVASVPAEASPRSDPRP